MLRTPDLDESAVLEDTMFPLTPEFPSSLVKKQNKRWRAGGHRTRNNDAGKHQFAFFAHEPRTTNEKLRKRKRLRIGKEWVRSY
jgi:hypothetical protein